MSSVDNRVVSIQFDNRQFEQKMAETLKSLDSLKKSLDFSNASKSFADLNKASSGLGLESIASGVENISHKFSALGVVGFEVIRNLTSSFMGLAKSIAGKVWDPMVEGGRQRALNIEQAKFLFRGLGMDVEQSMQDALKAVKGTAYGLDEAAKVASQFGASGIAGGEKMTGALRGVAGVAAMTGSRFSEIGQIFAQSAASGKVNTMDLQQFASRGLNVAASLGKAMGKSEQEIRKMASDGTLDFKTFAEGMDKAFGAHATEANQTYTGSLANLHAALSRLGASFIGPQLEQQRDLFNTLSPIIDTVAESLKPLIQAFVAIGRVNTNNLIKGLQGIDFSKFSGSIQKFSTGVLYFAKAIGNFIKPIKDAFQSVFAPNVVSTVDSLATAFMNFSKGLMENTKIVSAISKGFTALFSVLEIGWGIVKGVFGIFAQLLGALSPLGQGVGGAASSFADFLIHMNAILVTGGGLQRFFDNITGYIKKFADWMGKARDKVADIFSKGIPGSDAAENVLGRVSDRAQDVKDGFGKLGDAVRWIGDRFKDLGKVLQPVLDEVKKWAGELKDHIQKVFQPGDFDKTLDALNVGLLGGIVLILRNFMKNGLNINLGGNFMKSITGMFDQLTATLKSMQAQIKAQALMKIAEAILILTASIVVLSLIDSVALTKSLVAIAVGFGELVGVMALLDKISTGKSAAKFDALAAGLMVLGGAMLLLSIAMKILGSLSWGELAVALAGVAGGLALMALSVKLFSKGSSGLIKAGIGMIVISAGLLVLSLAIRSFANIPWGDMVHGFVGVAAGLGLIAGAMSLMPDGMIGKATGLLVVSVGLLILSKAVQSFAGMPWSEMGKGFLGIGAGLLIVAGAMHLMPDNMIVTAAALIIVGVALNIMAKAVQTMAAMKLGDMAKGIGGIAVMLLLLAAAGYAMEEALPGAAAMLVMAVSLDILGKVLTNLAKLSWMDLVKGLVAIAGVLAVLGVAALVMEPVIPALLGLGVALGAVGIAIALFGAGAFLLAKAFETMAKSGEAGAKAVVEAMKTIVTYFPTLATAMAKAFITFVMTVIDALPVIIKGLGVVLDELLQLLIDFIPHLGKAIKVLIETLIDVVKTEYPNLVKAGLEMILAILTGLRDNIPQIVTVVGEIITGFLDALSKQLTEIIDSVVNLFTTFLTDVATAMGKVAATIMFGVAAAFIKGFVDGLKGGEGSPQAWFMGLVGKVLGWIGDVLSSLWQKGADLLTGLWNGIQSVVGTISGWFVNLVVNVVTWIGDTARTLWDKGTGFIGGLLGGIEEKAVQVAGWFGGIAGKVLSWIGNVARTLWDKGTGLIGGLLGGIKEKWDETIGWFGNLGQKVLDKLGDLGGLLKGIGKSIIQGLWDGMKEIWDKATGWIGGIAGTIKNLKGPPKKDAVLLVNNGKLIMQGLQNGMEDEWDNVALWLSQLNPADHLDPKITDNMVSAINGSISSAIDQVKGMDEFQPVITPVLDLTAVQQGARAMGAYLGTSPMSANVSLAQAREIAHTTDRANEAPTTPPATVPTEVKFEQNIYSPTALSTEDIYRSTRSQIVLAKEELSIP